MLRRQISLFVYPENTIIEQFRAQFNPVQFELIPAHVTLCRENELEDLNIIRNQLQQLHQFGPLTIQFDTPVRFENDLGLMLPAHHQQDDFHRLRKMILNPSFHHHRPLPHLTLMHPRNSSCTDAIYQTALHTDFPKQLVFSTAFLIEQGNGAKWEIMETFPLSDN